MDLYFSPLACSLASRIAAYEAGADITFVPVDTKTGKLADGSDYAAVNGLGQVPALKTGSGQILTENCIVLQAIADAHPAAGLAPAPGTPERYELGQWLSFISTELHKAVFSVVLSPKAPTAAKAYALELLRPRLEHLDRRLAGREWLVGEGFTVADAYAAAVLNWTRFTGVDLGPYPNVDAYFRRLMARPSAERAATEEMALYQKAA